MRRAFVAVWIVLGLAGALNHTVLGHRLELVLPHLKYGYVMFNKNPRRVPVFEYARADGVRHDLADLEPRPAPGYARSRVAIDAITSPVYLRDLCNRALESTGDEITIFVDGYQAGEAMLTSTVHCGGPAR